MCTKYLSFVTLQYGPQEPDYNEVGQPQPASSTTQDYIPYVPLKKRREQQAAKYAAHITKRAMANSALEEDERYSSADDATAGPKATLALIDQAVEIKRKEAAQPKSELELKIKEEQDILAAQTRKKQLFSDKELAKGIVYVNPMKTSWTAPKYLLNMNDKEKDDMRKKWHIIADGEDIPTPIKSFKVSVRRRSSQQSVMAAGLMRHGILECLTQLHYRK